VIRKNAAAAALVAIAWLGASPVAAANKDMERLQMQVFYQVGKDWHYRKEERRWVSINDVSAWYRCSLRNGKVLKEQFHIR